MNGLAPVVNPPDGAATGGMTALIFHLVVTGVLLPAFVDYVRHKMTAGPTLLRWQPSVSCYYGALRRHGDRPPLDALLVITAGYIALVFVGNPTWQLHVLFALLRWRPSCRLCIGYRNGASSSCGPGCRGGGNCRRGSFAGMR